MRLILGDCLIEMAGLPKDDYYIITSPPYNMRLHLCGNKYTPRDEKTKHFSFKYASYTDDLPLEEYFDFQKRFIELAMNKCSLMFYNIQLVTGNKPSLFKIIGTFSEYIKEVIIWDKVNAEPAINHGVCNSQFEFILVFDPNNPHRRTFDFCSFDRGRYPTFGESRGNLPHCIRLASRWSL